MREQTIGGARLALAFARAHHPEINLSLIGGAYASLSGSQHEGMDNHMDAALHPAVIIVDAVFTREAEIARRLAQRQGRSHV